MRLHIIRTACLVLLTMTCTFAPAWGQGVPENAEAELVFAEAVEAFEAGEYATAFRRFRLVREAYPIHRKTTAAWIMAAKSAYRSGDRERAAEVARALLQAYPTSRYAPEASSIIDLAAARGPDQRDLASIGILLPMSTNDLALTQQMFNGIRIAVDEYNATASDEFQRIRMVFRASSSDPDRVRMAVDSLKQAGVSAIIGPLYSGAALAAATAAESLGVILFAPLATDDEVVQERRWVFQANPNPTMRGRLMARFAIRNLRMTRLGVIAEFDNGLSERMAEGFQEEVFNSGAELKYVSLLQSSTGWFRLADRIDPDTLDAVDALYLPITGGNATTLIKAAMDQLDRTRKEVRLLGNKEWHNLPAYGQPSKYNVIYTNDLLVTDSLQTVKNFAARYQALAAAEPGDLAYVGYDSARFLLYILSGRPELLPEAIRSAAPYQGLGVRFDFRYGNVNEAIYFMRYRSGQLELLR